jgi:hypothetical protein
VAAGASNPQYAPRAGRAGVLAGLRLSWHRIERNVRELVASVCEEAGERLFELRRNRLTLAVRQAQRHVLSASGLSGG